MRDAGRRWAGAVHGLMVIVFVLGVLCAGPQAAGKEYAFTLIADSSGALDTFGGGLGMNNAGVVVFGGRTDTGQSGIYKGSGGALTLLSVPTEAFPNPTDPSINNLGTVAFASGNTIVVNDGLASVPIGPSAAGFSIGAQWPRILGPNGHVAYMGTHSTHGLGVFVIDPLFGTLHVIASSADGFVRFGNQPAVYGGLAGNEAGQVAFYAEGAKSAIWRDSLSGPMIKIAEVGSFFSFISDDLNPMGMNNYGAVVFMARDGTGDVIAYGSGGGITRVADSTGPYMFLYGYPTINDANQVVFNARLDNGERGLYMGSDPVADKVIGTTDPLLGSSFFGSGYGLAINNKGQIAFTALLSDTRWAVVRADPRGATVQMAVPPSGGCGTATDPFQFVLNDASKLRRLVDSGGLGNAEPIMLSMQPQASLSFAVSGNLFSSILVPEIPLGWPDDRPPPLLTIAFPGIEQQYMFYAGTEFHIDSLFDGGVGSFCLHGLQPWVDAGQLAMGITLFSAEDLIQVQVVVRIPGDADLNGYVDLPDLIALARNWHATSATWEQGDFDGNNYVDLPDLIILARNWHVAIPLPAGGAVPEPAHLVLLVLGGLALIRRRTQSRR